MLALVGVVLNVENILIGNVKRSTSKRSESIIDFEITHDASGWTSEVLNEGTSDHFLISFQCY